jgi:hypothetical protein
MFTQPLAPSAPPSVHVGWARTNPHLGTLNGAGVRGFRGETPPPHQCFGHDRVPLFVCVCRGRVARV